MAWLMVGAGRVSLGFIVLEEARMPDRHINDHQMRLFMKLRQTISVTAAAGQQQAPQMPPNVLLSGKNQDRPQRPMPLRLGQKIQRMLRLQLNCGHQTEPPRICRRLFCLSHAAMGCAYSTA